MVISSDIQLKGTAWNKAIEELKEIFSSKPNYMIYLLSLSIGVMYDKRIELPDGAADVEPKSVPRSVIRNLENDRLEMIYQAAILTTQTEELTEEERLARAFDDKYDDKEKWALLIQFANFGVTKLVELIGNTPLESMENIKNFLNNTVEGKNLDIDGLSDDYLFDE